MCSAMIHMRRMLEFGLRQKTARNLLFAVGLIALICSATTSRLGRAQEGLQGGNAEGSAQASGGGSDAQAPSSTTNGDQGTSQNGNAEDTGQAAGANGGAQGPANGEGAGQTPGSYGQQQGPANGEGAGQTQGSNGEAQQAPANGEGAGQQAAPNGEVQGPGAGTSPSSQQNNGNRATTQTSRPQAANPRATPAQRNAPPRQTAPQQIQQQSPYGNMPSLQQLYMQVPSGGGGLQRFGSDAFFLGTGNANELPMDLPVGPDYVLGPGDSLVINMWGGSSNRLDRMIDRQGQIELPEAGTIMISGMTIAGAQNAIQQALNTQFKNERVEISLSRLRTVRVYVVGDVQRPGAYDVSSMSTPLSALYAAGGPTSRGSLRVLRQYRGSQLISQVDLYDFLLKGVRSGVERLLPGDTLMVPPAGPQVTIEGMVHRPAIYELNGEKTLNQVLELAGGVLGTASLKQINVSRLVAHERHTMLSLQLPSNPAELAQKLADFQVQGGDDVVISQILPYNQSAVYLEGHVYRPGVYPYQEGMTISDLLHSYQDVLPEPSDHAELVRLRDKRMIRFIGFSADGATRTAAPAWLVAPPYIIRRFLFRLVLAGALLRCYEHGCYLAAEIK